MRAASRAGGWWVLAGALLVAAGYLPTLAAPFDFIDDGNLVYPGPPGLSAGDHAARWWDKVAANVEHLGPFRPTLWVHWEVWANTLGADPVAWRAVRLAWCGFAAFSLLLLMRSLGLPPTAALLAAAAGLWNPYRNEIWTSLTLAEGVAMPYAMLALWACRRAAAAGRAWPWDLLAAGCLFVALGCKNTFAALVPAMLALRLLPDGATLREGWRAARWNLALLAVPLAMPAAHFVYFKMNWHPGQYETPGPSAAQALKFARWMKGAAGLDFVGAGLVFCAGCLAFAGRDSLRALAGRYRAALLAAAALALAGAAVYLPLPMMAARYTMPAVWGVDILVGVVLAGVLALPAARAPLPAARAPRLAVAAFGVGLAALAFANVGRQERVAARAGFLWEITKRIETSAPPGAVIDWVSGESDRGELNIEEGIHVGWHLKHRGRPDVAVRLLDRDGKPAARVELAQVPMDVPAFVRVAGGPAADAVADGWLPGDVVRRPYRWGRKEYAARLAASPPRPLPPGLFAPKPEPYLEEILRAGFQKPQGKLDDWLAPAKFEEKK